MSSGIRLSGMVSGLDTESIVSALVSAKSERKTTLEHDQKKLSWKQDAWKSLNTKIYSFYSKSLSDMRFQSDFMSKKTKSSNSAVSVVTSSSAPNCVQELKIKSMAKSGYHTGDQLASSVNSSTKLGDLLDSGWDSDGKAQFKFSVGKEGSAANKTIEINKDMTLSEFANKLSQSGNGINVNFDNTNKRFFISSTEMGENNEFNYDLSNGSFTSELLKKIGLAKDGTGEHAGEVVTAGTKTKATDAVILLNDAEFKSAKNTFEINGLTITLNNETDPSEKITLTTQQDTDGIYDKIKSFLKEYNELINEMDKLYNAESASKYKMLSDDEKDAMSEDDVKEWEDKIKSALLRKDSTLDSVASAMKTIMLSGANVRQSDGSYKRMYLSDFGINTAGYWSSADNEKNAYHIDGDTDDSISGTNEDKLKAMIATNENAVVDFFTGLAKDLYDKLGDLMQRTDYSSAFTVYNDKLMKDQYNDYTSKISKQEQLVNRWEDYYYDKFTAMEKALSELDSKQNSLSGLFGS